MIIHQARKDVGKYRFSLLFAYIFKILPSLRGWIFDFRVDIEKMRKTRDFGQMRGMHLDLQLVLGPCKTRQKWGCQV